MTQYRIPDDIEPWITEDPEKGIVPKDDAPDEIKEQIKRWKDKVQQGTNIAPPPSDNDDTTKDLSEAMKNLEDELSLEEKGEIKSQSQDHFMTQQHFGLGLFIRNHWDLHHRDSPFRSYLENLVHEEYPFFNADKLSGILLTLFYRYLMDDDINLEEQFCELASDSPDSEE